MNFFAWIRDGVRKAVLLGVSDAVGDIGPHADGDDIGHRLLGVIRNSPPAIANEMAAGESAKRKKLGRGLEQIQAGAAKAT
jgi:hypothetical protein